MEHMKMHKEYKVRIFSGQVDPAKLAVTLKLTSASKIAYIGCRDMLHERCMKFVAEHTHREYKWQYLVLMKGSFFVMDPRTMLWGEFVEQMDQMMTGECPEFECCICFDKSNLIKCPQCTMRYCKKCMFGKSIDCYVCASKLWHDARKDQVLVEFTNHIGMRLGCLFKILHVKFGMETMHMLRRYTAKEITTVLIDLWTDEKYHKYFDADRYWNTFSLFMEHVGLSSRDIDSCLKNPNTTEELAEFLKKIKK